MRKFLGNAANGLKIRAQRYYAYASTLIKTYMPFSKETAYVAGFYATIVGAVIWGIDRWMFHVAVEMQSSWVPGFVGWAGGEKLYNAPVITYILMVLAIVGWYGLYLLFYHAPVLRKRLSRLSQLLLLPLLVFDLVGYKGARLFPSGLCFLFSFLIFLPAFISFFTSDKTFKPLMEGVNRYTHKKSVLLLVALPIIVAITLATRVWYPVQIPNDYYEIPDSITLPSSDAESSPQVIGRPEVLKCLEVQNRKLAAMKMGTTEAGVFTKSLSDLLGIPVKESPKNSEAIANALFKITGITTVPAPICDANIPVKDLSALEKSIMNTGPWQSQTGRLFYHQSYMTVPALHMLKYGILSPIPHLYGLGHTLFHATLMHFTSPTLTGYFNTIPIAHLMGALAILLLVLYVTRSALAMVAAAAVHFIFFYNMDMSATLLAPGFSLLRAAGLVAQIASIFWLLRGTSALRPMGMLVALALSLFWNTEFAFIGFIGQALALLSPQLRLKPWLRIAYAIGLAVIGITFVLVIAYLERGFPKTTQTVLFGLVPVLSGKNFIRFCIKTVFCGAILGYGATRFSAGERAARLYTLPILALINMRYLYSVAPLYLDFCLAFIAPVAVIYYQWQPSRTSVNRWRMEAALVGCLSILCLSHALSYVKEAKSFRKVMVAPYTQQAWTGLGESFAAVTPATPIVSRIEAIKSQLRPGDKVVFFSPFDHLMSVYANPEHYCGHFELITNLITNGFVESLVDCIRTSPNALVVYDDAVETPCPVSWEAKYYSSSECGIKKVLEQNSKTVLDSLKNDLVLVRKIGPLSFYRHAESKESR